MVNPDTAASVTDTLSADAVQRSLATVAPTVEFLAPQRAPAPDGPNAAPSARTPNSPSDAPAVAPVGLSPESTAPPISYPLLIAAGVIALIELILARFFSHATIASTPRDAASATIPKPASPAST